MDTAGAFELLDSIVPARLQEHGIGVEPTCHVAKFFCLSQTPSHLGLCRFQFCFCHGSLPLTWLAKFAVRKPAFNLARSQKDARPHLALKSRSAAWYRGQSF
jgi:hypothetical protein